MTTIMSIKIDRKNAGMVILVGSAARLVTNARPIALKEIITREKLLLVNITAITVNGVRKEACSNSATPNQMKRAPFCSSAHFKN